MAIEINQDNFQQHLEESNLMVVDIFTTTCGPCKMYAPIFEEVSSEVNGVTMAKLNGSDNRDILSKYEVRSVPTTLFIKGGELLEKKVGLIQKNDLIELINKHNN